MFQEEYWTEVQLININLEVTGLSGPVFFEVMVRKEDKQLIGSVMTLPISQ